MDAITDPTVEKVAVIKGAQIGWTEIVNNAIGYFVDHDPAPLLTIQPTIEMAEAWSKERLAPMIRDTTCIRDKFNDPRSRDSGNTLRHKEFDGGFVAIIGANAPAGLASRPIRVVLADEIDRYPLSAGTEGDPLKLAEKRQATFWNRKTVLGSTPTNKATSVIEREYLNSDQRKYHVPCPHCGESQVLTWEQVKWEKNGAGEHRPETAHYLCEHCGILLTDAERWAAIARGKWQATAPFRGVAGFHLSQLYSPWVKLERIVREFLEAQGNPTLLQVFVNTVLGETWEEVGEQVDAAGIKSHVEAYGPDDLSDGVHYATLGGDVHPDRIECEIVGWGAADESWGIQYEVLYGDPARPEIWQKVDELRRSRFWTVGGRLVRIRSACFDTGGHHAAHVINYCRARVNEGVYPIKGASGPRPVWPKHASKSTNTKENIWIVGVDTAKDAIYGRFRIAEPGPGYCHLPQDYDDDWFAQVTAETVVTRYKEGRPYRVWTIPNNARNEALDCRVYAYAARLSLTEAQIKPSPVRAADTNEKQRIDIEAKLAIAARGTAQPVKRRGPFASVSYT